MSFRDNIFVQLKVPIPQKDNRFTRGRCMEPSNGKFMENRQMPYQGWLDRQAGCYFMAHNKIIREVK